MDKSVDIYSSPEYKRSRAAYVMECTFEYFVSLLVGDAYLATLLRYMGIGDAMIGIISSLITLAFLFNNHLYSNRSADAKERSYATAKED